MDTAASVTGKVSHTPVTPASDDRINAKGMIRKNPLISEMICAGRAWLVEVKNMDRIMLKPTKGAAKK